MREQTDREQQYRRGSRQQELIHGHAPDQRSRATPPDALDTGPASQPNARHEHADQNRKFMVDIAVDRLERKQQEDLERHQYISDRCRTTESRGAFPTLPRGQSKPGKPGQQQEDKHAPQQRTKPKVRRSRESAGIA